MRTIALLILAFLIGFSATFVYGAYANRDDGTLKAGSLVCATPWAAEELAAAVKSGDREWINSISGCVVSAKPVKMRTLDCRSANCPVRLFLADGETAVVYRAGR